MKSLFYIFSLIIFFGITACNSERDKITPAFDDYKFDRRVIEKLPLYDSLTAGVLEKINVFLDIIDTTESYQAFRYMPEANELDAFKKLPDTIKTDIDNHFAKIGKDFIYGFDVFKDSSIKIYIRVKTIDSTAITIEENLSYFPKGNSNKEREYPIKDTILNASWQYWTRFSKEGLF